MKDNYIPLRVNREFGEIISTYFDFFKQNIKNFTNVFINYNGIFLVGLLIASYLLVSGFIGIIAHEYNYGNVSGEIGLEQNYYLYLGFGGFLFFVIFICVAVLNYSLSSSYIIKYVEKKSSDIDKKEVWEYAKSQFGNIIVFVLLLIPFNGFIHSSHNSNFRDFCSIHFAILYFSMDRSLLFRYVRKEKGNYRCLG